MNNIKSIKVKRAMTIEDKGHRRKQQHFSLQNESYLIKNRT